MARRKSGNVTSSRNAQPTLSFNHKSAKVTKPSATDAIKNNKKAEVVAPANKKTTTLIEDELHNASALDAPIETTIETPVPVISQIVKDEIELEAEKISNKALVQYWQGEEAKRKAKRVHQDDLSTNEKILRHFDLSSQFGPCIGITRLKRWKRANTLGLRPPIEVLTVILKEEQRSNTKARQAYVDELISGQRTIE